MAFWNRSVFAGDADAEQRAEGRMAGVAAIEAEHELVEVGLQVLAAQAVVDAERPAFEVGEEAMCPGQDNVRGHRSDDVRVVSDAGSAGVSRPAIGFRGGAGGDIGVDESVQAGGGEVRDRRQPHPARPMAVHLDAPPTSILPWPLRPRPPSGGSSLLRCGISVSSISTRPFSGGRSGATMARRSLAQSSHAVLYEPSPSCFCTCRAEMPLEWVAIR